MTLAELKDKLNNQENIPLPIIFMGNEDTLIRQYADAIGEHLQQSLRVIDSYEEMYMDSGLFTESNELLLLKNETLIYPVSDRDHLIVQCKKLHKDIKDSVGKFVVTVPEVDPWQLEAYAKTVCPGVDEKQLTQLLVDCQYNVTKTVSELEKISIFDKKYQATLFDMFIQDGIFEYLSNKTVFDLSNALLRHDREAVARVLSKIDVVDITPMYLYIVLYQAFRKVIMVQLHPNASPETAGLTSKQFWAVKKSSIGFYTKAQLMAIFELLTGIDSQIKSGDVPMEILIDYLITSILGVI